VSQLPTIKILPVLKIINEMTLHKFFLFFLFKSHFFEQLQTPVCLFLTL